MDPAEESPGAIFAVPLETNSLSERVTEWRNHGLSEAFIAIMTELHKQGIPYVRFDADAADVEGAPVFEW